VSKVKGTAKMSAPLREGGMELTSERQWKRSDVVGRINAEKLTMVEASRICGISVRQLRRIRKAVAERGKEALIHGQPGRSPTNRTAQGTRCAPSRWRQSWCHLERDVTALRHGETYDPRMPTVH
jgi:hypothetical protein